MDIQGLQKTTLLDFPGKVACTVFLAGCNLRCPFCHNASLVLQAPETAVTEEALMAFLKKRRGILDGVGHHGVVHQVAVQLRHIHVVVKLYLRRIGSDRPQGHYRQQQHVYKL